MASPNKLDNSLVISSGDLLLEIRITINSETYSGSSVKLID